MYRLMLVDDEPEIRDGLQEIIQWEQEGFQVVGVAENGLEVLSALQKKKYDLILMDIQMPVMDGLAAAEAIRSMSEYKNLPIIAMTAHAMVGDRETSLKSGMNDHITKPIDPGLLYDALMRWDGRSE